MRRFVIALAAGLLMASVAGPVSATGPANRGFLPPNAHPRGHSLVDIATAWNAWALSPPAANNPLLLARCEPSPIDPKIWFLPEPIPGGLTTSTCVVPQGAYLVVSPFFFECSQAEPEPFHGDNKAELRACVKRGFGLLSSVEVTLDGRTATHLGDYVVATRLDTLPADNLLGPDPTLTMNKGIFMVTAPLSRGTHTLSASWEIESMDVQAAISFTIIVSRGRCGRER
jgi:hypothetical protein